MYSFFKTGVLLALIAAATVVQGTPVDKRYVLMNLPENADPKAIKFETASDFNTDGCYNTAAIGVEGMLDLGLQH